MKPVRSYQLGSVVLVLTTLSVAFPQDQLRDAAIQRRVNEIHGLIWRNYIQPENNQLLTRLDLAGKPLYIAGLPVSPSLEDSTLYGGTYLDALAQHYEVTKKPGVAARVRAIYQGLIKNATVSPSKGILARGTHPDGVTYWGNASGDQYTGFFFGLWRYSRSSLVMAEEKAEISTVITNLLGRLQKDGWTVMDERGVPVRFGALGALTPTPSLRLLAMLLVGWDVTGDERWMRQFDQEKKMRLDAVRDVSSEKGAPWVQMMNAMALRALLDLDKDNGDQLVFRHAARKVAEACLASIDGYKKLLGPAGRLLNREELYAAAGLRESLVTPGCKDWQCVPAEFILTSALRNPFNAIGVIFLLGQQDFYGAAMNAYREMILGIDYTQLRYVGFVFPGEYNYWLAVRRGLVKYDPSFDVETREEAYRMLREDVYSAGSQGKISLR